MKRILSLTLGLLCTSALACQSMEEDDIVPVERRREEAKLRAVDQEWSEAASRGDLDAVLGFMAENGETLAPNEPAARDRSAVRASWEALLALPDVAVSWQPLRVEVAKSGEQGFTSGTYTLSFTGPDGNPVHDKGKYLEVWVKVNGHWRCLMDAYSSDLPLPQPDGGP